VQGVPYERPSWSGNNHHPPVKVVNGVPRYILGNPRQRHHLHPLQLPALHRLSKPEASVASISGMRGSSAATIARGTEAAGGRSRAEGEAVDGHSEAQAEATGQPTAEEDSWDWSLTEQKVWRHQGLYAQLYQQKRRKTPNLGVVTGKASRTARVSDGGGGEPLDVCSWPVPQSRGADSVLGGDELLLSYVNQPPSRGSAFSAEEALPPSA
jgi:hypothetical protein